MKNLKAAIATVVMFLLLTGSAMAEGNTAKTTVNDVDTIVDNLIVGAKSDNDGLRISSAYQLGEFKSDKAVTPLLKVLKSGKSDAEKIVAALSLTKLRNPRGLFAVKRASIFDDSEQVRKMCKKFYFAYVGQNNQ